MSDPYLLRGTDVLRNKLGISDLDQLERAIDDIAIAEAVALFAARRTIRPTMSGWQAVHKAMFGSVFDWAGRFRTIHIRKAGEEGRREAFFVGPDRIAAEGAKAAKNLAATLRHAGDRRPDAIADGLADAYAQLNEVHPFREGNGRSQKVFFSATCRPQGLEIRWDRIPADQHNEAARRASAGDLVMMREHFRMVLTKASAPGLYLSGRN